MARTADSGGERGLCGAERYPRLLPAYQATPPRATEPAATAIAIPATTLALEPEEPSASSDVPATAGSSAMPPTQTPGGQGVGAGSEQDGDQRDDSGQPVWRQEGVPGWRERVACA